MLFSPETIVQNVKGAIVLSFVLMIVLVGINWSEIRKYCCFLHYSPTIFFIRCTPSTRVRELLVFFSLRANESGAGVVSRSTYCAGRSAAAFPLDNAGRTITVCAVPLPYEICVHPLCTPQVYKNVSQEKRLCH